MNLPFGKPLLIAAVFLFGLYEVGYGFYAWRLNGFRFYITAGFLIGCPFLIIGTILLLLPRQVSPVWEVLPLLLWIFGVTWKAWKKRVAKREHPDEWARWEDILRGS